MEENVIRKGVKTKLFGVLLIILGALDSMLSWRGGFAPSGIYVFLLSAGIALYAIGSVRGSNPSPRQGRESEADHAKPGS
jgi:hypothetical protein